MVRIDWFKKSVGWLMGFEPTTTGITIQDSTAELQPPPPAKTTYKLSAETGLPDRNRTCDPQLRRLMLYPTELRAESPGSNSDTRRKVQHRNAEMNLEADGRGERNRTSDILLPKQALYQAELRPERVRL